MAQLNERYKEDGEDFQYPKYRRFQLPSEQYSDFSNLN